MTPVYENSVYYASAVTQEWHKQRKFVYTICVCHSYYTPRSRRLPPRTEKWFLFFWSVIYFSQHTRTFARGCRQLSNNSTTSISGHLDSIAISSASLSGSALSSESFIYYCLTIDIWVVWVWVWGVIFYNFIIYRSAFLDCIRYLVLTKLRAIIGRCVPLKNLRTDRVEFFISFATGHKYQHLVCYVWSILADEVISSLYTTPKEFC